MPPEFYEIDQPTQGRLWIMPCPDGERLALDIEAYRAAGMTRVVSMLAADEADALGLAAEEQACAAAGLRFHAHPITDFGLPDLDAFAGLVAQIKGWLADGQAVGVHCRAGIGRSGMVTCGVLVASGLSAQGAIEKVTHARGVSIPDTVEQDTFIKSYARKI